MFTDKILYEIRGGPLVVEAVGILVLNPALGRIPDPETDIS